MRAILLLGLIACDGADRLPADQVAVAPGFDAFVAGEMISGQPFRVTWADRTPGERVFFGVSTSLGSTVCPPTLAGDCLDIGPMVTLLGSARVQPDGYATVTGVVPPVPDGIDVHFQAAAFDAAGVYVGKSEVDTVQTGFTLCPLVFDEVCTVDGSSQINDCFADALGWPVEIDGPCP